jgi:hypothetical protein
VTPAIVVAAAATLFRVVPLACSGERLAIAGGAVLRLADGARCDGVVAGRPLVVALDPDGRATPHAPDASARPSSEIPRTAFVLAPSDRPASDDASLVTVTIDVTVPPRTPAGDDIYVSTERSGWSPSEIRMDRVDARHYRLRLQLHRAARLAFRITRGSYGTIERDAAQALPPAHVIVAQPEAHIEVTVAAWADVD